MYSICCTRKLLDRGTPQPGAVTTEPTTVLGNWYANLVISRPQHLVVCISERTLLPVIVPAKDIQRLPDRIAAAVAEILTEIGIAKEDVDAEISEIQTANFSKTANRRLLGSLNDFIFHLQHGAAMHPELTLRERTLRLARMPCAVIDFAYPSEAALAAFITQKALRVAKSAA